MARSLYKARGMGTLPPCAICMGPGVGGRSQLHLPFGLSVWLCSEHRSPEFLARRAGRDLVVSLSGVWDAAGCMTASRRRALHSLLVAPRPSRSSSRPGSYAWPDLRREAESRFARGEDPRVVIRELRSRHAGDPARAPTVRTMRRWFTEERWRDQQAPVSPRPLSEDPGGTRRSPPVGRPPAPAGGR